MNVPFLDLSFQEACIQQDREQRFKSIISLSSFVLGPHVEAFESAFAQYCGQSFAIGVSGGTAASTMIYRALGIGETDEVLMQANTFIASAGSVIHAGATPVFVDISENGEIDLGDAKRRITSRTKAILAVHLYGMPADMSALLAFAQEHNLAVIEDACQAHGARYKGARVGSFGVAASFSFYPGKNLGAYGDGGAIVTNEASIATTVRKLRNQGCATKYDHELLGYNARLDALQAAVVHAKLGYLDSWNEMRRSIATRYRDGLRDTPLTLPTMFTEREPVWHLFTVQVPGDRDNFMHYLAEKGVSTGIHYPVPLHMTPALKHLGYQKGDMPRAESVAERLVSLPVFPGMSTEQVDHVITSVTSYFT